MKPRNLLLLASMIWLMAPSTTASALPMYAMRSARTCGNCHVSPTLQDKKGWKNPVWWKRKCTMSCAGCHVNPTGGGLRNVSGRYYGKSTLSVLASRERSYSDRGRELAPRSLIAWFKRIAGAKEPRYIPPANQTPSPKVRTSKAPTSKAQASTATAAQAPTPKQNEENEGMTASPPSPAPGQSPPREKASSATSPTQQVNTAKVAATGKHKPPKKRAHNPVLKTVPTDYGEVMAGIGVGARGTFSEVGKALNGQPQGEYAFWDGRYADLRADPLFTFGADSRFAYWSGSDAFFPMQLDLHGALHVVEHVTLMATASARGRSGGPGPTLGQDRFPIFARNAFLMIHELPAMAYVKAGIFLPSFGTHLDDHTSFTRSFFEMDVSQSEDTVWGVEIGLAPNYPFLTLSVFRNFLPPDTPEGTDPGFGMALNLGWRDILWHLTAHGMIKRRDLAARGDLSAAGFGWGLNLFALSNYVPITYMGEFSFGHVQRQGTGSQATVLAMYHELWFTLFNGISLRAKYDYGSKDAEVEGDSQHRLSIMLDLGIIPGWTMIAGTRTALAGPQKGDTDLMVQTHFWF